MNHYQKAISSLGTIISDYSTENKYSMYGFGALVGHTTQVSHCFQIGSEEVEGLDGMMAAYSQCVHNVHFSGPTLFVPLISTLAAKAINLFKQKNEYTVLLILCDGQINDMEESIDLIVSFSDAPLSIIIIGVGEEDFSEMHRLAPDNGILTDTLNNPVGRDNIQFVEFQDYSQEHFSVLNHDVLYEVPNQLLSFMKRANIVPPPSAVIADDGVVDVINSLSQLHVQKVNDKNNFLQNNPNFYINNGNNAPPPPYYETK